MEPQIITLTLNPAIDYVAASGAVCHTHKVRMGDGEVTAGGGGINVSRVARELGCGTVAVFLAGGVTGSMLGQLLERDGIPACPIPIAAETRMCVTAIERGSGHEYRLIARGPVVQEPEWQAALDCLDRLEGDWIVASGSLPSGVPGGIYASAALRARAQGRQFALDTSGEALATTLRSGCAMDLLKLSLSELEDVVGRPLASAREQEAAALDLVEIGAARVVAVTLGAEGAFVAADGCVHRMSAMEVPPASALGAGDSFMAGMVAALARGHALGDALGWAVATGTAAVAAAGVSHVRRHHIDARLCQPNTATVQRI